MSIELKSNQKIVIPAEGENPERYGSLTAAENVIRDLIYEGVTPERVHVVDENGKLVREVTFKAVITLAEIE